MKKSFLLIILLVVSLSAVFAELVVSYSPSVEGYAQFSFTTPKEKAGYLKTDPADNKLPVFRSSIDFEADVMPVQLKVNDFTIGLGGSVMYNTRSLIAGNHFLRPYWGYGATFGVKKHLEGPYSIRTKVRYLFCSIEHTKNRFDVFEVELKPGYDFIQNGKFELNLTAPMNLSFKADTCTFRMGVGLDFQYNLVFGGSNE